MTRRAIVLIVDGCGIGASPDCHDYNDSSSANTLANVANAAHGLHLPNMQKLGLGNICALQGMDKNTNPLGVNAMLEEASKAKDTQTGHWEMMGITSQVGFPLYPNGFPDDVVQEFIKQTQCQGILVNKPYSGTQVLDDYGLEHCKTGYPIVYTSGDSVFQLACHVDVVDIEKQYKWCEIARKILKGEHNVGRVIARPFEGEQGHYKRISALRHDYTVLPPQKTLLDQLIDCDKSVLGIGKIEDIFCKQGLSHAIHTGSNREGLELTIKAMKNQLELDKIKLIKDSTNDLSFIFTNLVDTDSLYGHRRDPLGYYQALKEIDEYLGLILQSMTKEDMLIISSDHGNDPTATGTDHTREYVPFLLYNPNLVNCPKDLGAIKNFSQIGLSIQKWLNIGNKIDNGVKLDERISQYLNLVA